MSEISADDRCTPKPPHERTLEFISQLIRIAPSREISLGIVVEDRVARYIEELYRRVVGVALPVPQGFVSDSYFHDYDLSVPREVFDALQRLDEALGGSTQIRECMQWLREYYLDNPRYAPMGATRATTSADPLSKA